jgi:hypothetical protein
MSETPEAVSAAPVTEDSRQAGGGRECGWISRRLSMERMTIPITLAALALLAAEGRTQSVAPADRAPLNALVLEVRLLRQAIERQTAATVKSQLLASQLAVQHQRVVRAEEALDRAADAVEAATRRQDQLRGSLARLTRGEDLESSLSSLDRELRRPGS